MENQIIIPAMAGQRLRTLNNEVILKVSEYGESRNTIITANLRENSIIVQTEDKKLIAHLKEHYGLK